MDRIKKLETDSDFECYITGRPLLVRLNTLTRQIEIMSHVQDELLNDLMHELENQEDEEE